ncbi:MAG TPA: response regulator [Candidatus Krumholzibacteriaceae bacterium]|jgi:DNA-binding NtrC family response regulator|nr:response regulator [Candidatus Krumholzibacteriaceae bacterium]
MGERARILVVDDDESIRKTLAAILEDEGYDVDTVKNGKGAIQKTNARFYNLTLVDIRLPDMEGVKLLTAMRETTPKMIKIVITGYPSVQNAIAAVNKDADAYLVKPLDIAALLQTIKEHLKKQQQAKKYSEEKVTEFIQTRVKEIEEETTPLKKTR